MARAMKDSGVEWIGEIPQGWGVAPMGSLFDERKHKNLHSEERNLLSLSYGKIVRKSMSSNEGLLPANFLSYNIIETGDIVFRLTDLQNDQKSLRSGLVMERGIITSAYTTVTPVEDVDCRYCNFYFRACDQEKALYGMGAGVRQSMRYDDLKRLPLLLPPLSEQRRIADYLDKRCAAIDFIITTRQKQLDRLEDYRKALIFAYVTGKKEVPVA